MTWHVRFLMDSWFRPLNRIIKKNEIIEIDHIPTAHDLIKHGIVKLKPMSEGLDD